MKHSVYFDGKVQSLSLATSDASATVGVIEPGTYVFSTTSTEHITVIEGALKVRLAGGSWQEIGKGKKVVVPPGVSFDIDAGAPAAYICYYK